MIALSITIVLTLLLTRRLIIPIKCLSKEMEEVAKGRNLDTYLQVTTKDEIGHLTESYNQMIQNLKESQKSLRETEGKYHRIFEDSKDRVYITSADGKLLDVNQAGVDLFGYGSKEEMMQVHVRDTFFIPRTKRDL